MTFDAKYPQATHGFETGYDDEPWNVVLLVYGECPCVVCGRSTQWVAIAFECSVCSEECIRSLDAEFQEASRKTTDS